ncbi:hypothetical protein CY35_15G086600 [Sphagnum magellanicum]|nr:hypothetical protein CY35_15G086600 [Sphagnum magellanicum]
MQFSLCCKEIKTTTRSASGAGMMLMRKQQPSKVVNNLQVVVAGGGGGGGGGGVVSNMNHHHHHHDSLAKRVEIAEKLIKELRQSAAKSCQQVNQAKADLEELRSLCLHQEEEKKELQDVVDRLRQLCMDHEKSIYGLRQGLKTQIDATESCAKNNKLQLLLPDAGSDADDESSSAMIITVQLQKELHRLSGIEVSLRSELEVYQNENTQLRTKNQQLKEKLGKWSTTSVGVQCLQSFEDQQKVVAVSCGGGGLLNWQQRGEAAAAAHAATTELHEEVNLLAAKLGLVMSQKQHMREALRVSEEKLAGAMEENKSLKEELGKERRAVHARAQDVQNLERQLEAFAASNQMLQAMLFLREKSAAICSSVQLELQGPGGASGMEKKKLSEAQTLRQVQQHWSTTAEEPVMMEEKSFELQCNSNSSSKAEELMMIPCLQQTLLDLTQMVSSQNSCVVRLSAQNEELARLSQSQVRQIDDLHAEIGTAVKRKEKAIRELKQFREKMEDREKEMEERTSICEMLQEYVIAMQADLRQCHAQVTVLLQSHDDLKAEKDQLQCSHAEACFQISELKKQLKERVEATKLMVLDLDKSSKQVEKLQLELCRMTEERDEMQEEADSMGREALHIGLEVELLRRRLLQLEEDLLLKDGQIAILRSRWEGVE